MHGETETRGLIPDMSLPSGVFVFDCPLHDLVAVAMNDSLLHL